MTAVENSKLVNQTELAMVCNSEMDGSTMPFEAHVTSDGTRATNVHSTSFGLQVGENHRLGL